ncbi:heme ABC transporter ATP-binding protein/permease CydC [Candidatus Schmidhempelia bombi]|uniref:Cysteine/glutathione ABC transporter ATP-binding protein/permease CydC n=1 Tax=Candidatus Schmidhempelia bombi str. Bimp TaxID=1387197 RepID=A0AB94IDL5_9GAMM|nr:cysteine/glutathione ABC transporter ATP-binding protein/permease CydC [Candidatus Schmidhempelia bombi]TEA27557.1 cysteine/glutathione ABC transporter ATP-binding protein/permease CydC [Candidatus Schmidhempelia bombi str. Bimp]
MKALLPFLALYKRYLTRMALGMLLALVTLLSSLFLLSLSGWFLAATAFAGIAGLYTFNYMLPAAGVRGAAILRTTARYAERLVSHNTTFKLLAFLRILAFKKIVPLSSRQRQHYQKADLLNRFIADIDHLDHVYLKLLSPFITGFIAIIVLFLGLSPFNLSLAILISTVLLLTLIMTPIYFYQAGKTTGQQLAQQKSDYRQHVVSYLQGQAELTIFDAREQFRQQLDQAENRWLQNQQQQAKLASMAQSWIIIIIGLLTSLVLYLSISGITFTQPPIIALFVFICLSCAEILAPIPNAFIYLGHVIASAKRIGELFNQQPDIDYPSTSPIEITTAPKLQLTDVTFTYPQQQIATINQLCWEINAGEHIALIGKTGCGKSTILKLITRTWEANQGQITINDVDLRDFSESSLRNFMAVIPQRIDIFNDTLRNNLLIGNPSATDQQLIEVLTLVGLEKLLASENGLTLWLGENGRALSGGEKRRIGIARALLHDAPLVLMDEPTESLDNETEQQIIALIRQIYTNKTLIMVTHRLTEHQMFDKVYMMENGKIMQK